MDVTLPNGKVIKGIPEGTSKDEIRQKAISAGLAEESDFPAIEPPVESGSAEVDTKNPDTHLGRYQAKLKGILDSGVGVAEATMHHATAFPASVAGGLVGIGQTLNPFAEEGAGSRAVRQVQDTFTYQPRSEKGQQIVGSSLADDPNIGPAVQMVQKGIDATRMGDETLEAGGGPLLGTINELGPEIVGSMVGLRGLQKPAPPKMQFDKTGAPKPMMGKDARLASELRNHPKNPEIAKYDLVNNKAVKSPVGKAAVGQGWTESTVAGVKAGNAATKKQVRKMVNLAKQRLTGGIEDEMRLRPSDVAGDSLYKRYKFLDQSNKAAGKLLGKIAKDMGDTPVDTSKAAAWFGDKLDEFGIRITEKGKVDFSQSSLPKSDRAMIIENIEQIRRLQGGQTFQSAHDLKRILRRTGLSYKETIAKKGASEDAQKLFKGYSAKIDEVLDATSSAYDKQNIKFADTRHVIEKIEGLIKDRLLTDTADSSMGTKMRRLTGNAETRPDLINMLDDIESVAQKYGGKFDDDLWVQQHIANEMDRVLGVAADTSIQGEMAVQAAEAAGRSTAANATKSLQKGMDIIHGKTPEKALNTLEALTR